MSTKDMTQMELEILFQSYHKGDLVVLKSNTNTEMTVRSRNKIEYTVTVNWFDDEKHLQQADFDFRQLEVQNGVNKPVA